MVFMLLGSLQQHSMVAEAVAVAAEQHVSPACSSSKLRSEKSNPYKLWDSTKWHTVSMCDLSQQAYLNEWCTYLHISLGPWLLDMLHRDSYNMVAVFSWQ